MLDTLRTAIAKFDTSALFHVRRTLEAELLAAFATSSRGTQAHVGQIELLTAIGEELLGRGALGPRVPWVEVNMEDGIPMRHPIRVF